MRTICWSIYNLHNKHDNLQIRFSFFSLSGPGLRLLTLLLKGVHVNGDKSNIVKPREEEQMMFADTLHRVYIMFDSVHISQEMMYCWSVGVHKIYTAYKPLTHLSSLLGASEILDYWPWFRVNSNEVKEGRLVVCDCDTRRIDHKIAGNDHKKSVMALQALNKVWNMIRSECKLFSFCSNYFPVSVCFPFHFIS